MQTSRRFRNVCPFTTDPIEAPLFHLEVEPDAGNGLRAPCRLLVDKITTVFKTRLARKIARLTDQDMMRLNRAILVFLGIAAPAKAR
jgi:mRNA interferase MazF